jgi:hypothetical protein
MMRPAIALTQALSDPDLFGPVFAAPSFWTWKVVAKLIDGLPLTEQREIELFEQCTGRSYNRQSRRAVCRLFVLCGRRGGKDRFESAVAMWRAALCADWRQHTSAGEGAVCLLLGADRKQAGILAKYCAGLASVPLLAKEEIRDEVFRYLNIVSLQPNDATRVKATEARNAWRACRMALREDADAALPAPFR